MELLLDAPPVNALGTPILEQVRDTLRAAGDEPILLCGAGPAFSAGLNLAEVASLSADDMVVFLDLLEEVVGLLYHHPGPTVAYVHGHAIAGGCVLALCCDVRIGSLGRHRIGLNEVALGLQFPPRTEAIVTRQIPVGARHRVLLGAGLFAPEEALSLGLLDELGGRDRADAVLDGLAKHPRDAYAATKGRLRPDTTPSAAVRQAFFDEVVPAWTSDGVKARIRAILDRR